MANTTFRVPGELEERMTELALANNGRIDLDFSNDLHYNYFIEQWGGERLLNETAPDFLALVKKQRRRAFAVKDSGLGTPGKETTGWGTTTKLEIECPIARNKIRSMEGGCDSRMSRDTREYTVVSGSPSASYVDDEGSVVDIKYRITDVSNRHIIAEGSESPDPDGLIYKVDISTEVPAQGRDQKFQIRADFSRTANVPGTNELALAASFVCTSVFSKNTTDDIESIMIVAPIRKPDVVRSCNPDHISIYYDISRPEGPPDYNIPHYSWSQLYMPVYLPFEMVVTLKKESGAYFKANENNSYLDSDYDPRIALSRLTTAAGDPVVGGEVVLVQDWVDFSAKCITVEQTHNQKAVALRLKFPEDWEAKMEFKTVSMSTTYARFYSYIRFNTVNKDDKGEERDNKTSVIINHLPNPSSPYNPSKPGEGVIHIPDFYFCWDCLTGESEILTPGGIRYAKDIAAGEEVTVRGGGTARVKDVRSGYVCEVVTLITKSGRVCMTPDHMLAAPGGCRTAVSLKPGDYVLVYDAKTGGETAEEITEIEVGVYESKVYEFTFDEGALMVAGGLLVCDHTMQQNIFRSSLPKLRYTNAMNVIRAQLRSLSGEDSLPVFVKSDTSECIAAHYFAVAALAGYITKWDSGIIQNIAEYCQFIADNATVGGLVFDEVTPEINSLDICTVREDKKIIVPIIPTAMERWYDNAELNTPKPWLLPPDVDIYDRKYDMINDVLIPFHYPTDSGGDSQVVFNSTMFSKRLSDVAARASKTENPTKSLQMEIALVVHLLIDSMLHERYTGKRNWVNLGRIDRIYNPAGDDVTAKYPPYINFDYGELEEYPAGLQQSGRSAHISSARLDYMYPLNIDELPFDKESEISNYSGHRTPHNPQRLTRACKALWDFLHRCIGETPDSAAWNDVIETVMLRLFSADTEDYELIRTKWKNEFTNFDFKYDAKSVYDRLTVGDPEKTRDIERYEEFFIYIMTLYNEKNKPLDKNPKITSEEVKKASICYEYDETKLVAWAEFQPDEGDESVYSLDVSIIDIVYPYNILSSKFTKGSGSLKCVLDGIDIPEKDNTVNYRVKAIVTREEDGGYCDDTDSRKSSTETRKIAVLPWSGLLSVTSKYGIDINTGNSNGCGVSLQNPSAEIKAIANGVTIADVPGVPKFICRFADGNAAESAFNEYNDGVIYFSDARRITVSKINLTAKIDFYADLDLYDEDGEITRRRRVHVVFES